MSSQIFISYSKKDKDFAWKLADDLADAGHKVWIDRSLQVGEDWKESIIKNLEEADEVIVLLSSSAISSKWVQHEGSIAYGLKKKMYPVLIESLPADELPLWMNEFQYHSFINVEYELAFGTLHAALTPPNPIQDLLDQQVNAYRRTGDLMSNGLLELIKENWETLTISQEAEKLIQASQEKHQQELSEQARRRAAEALAESSTVLSSLMAEGEVPEQVIMQLSQVVACDRCALFLEDAYGVLQLLAHHGFPEDVRMGDLSYHLEENDIYANIKHQSGPFVVQDINRLQGWKQPDWVPKDHTWLGVPLNANGKTIGMLVLSRGTGASYNQDDVLLASNFAVQASIALENGRLFHETERLAQELERRVVERTAQLQREQQNTEFLLRILTEVSSSLDLDRSLSRTLALLNEAIGAEQGTVMLLNWEDNLLYYRAGYGYLTDKVSGEGHGVKLKIGEGLAGWVVAQREPALVEDLLDDPRWVKASASSRDQRSAIAMPLLVAEDVIGVLLVFHRKPGYFGAEVFNLVKAVAGQIAVSINNAHVYELVRDQAERLGSVLRREQEDAARSQAILDSVADGVLVTGSDNRIRLINSSAAQILDLEPGRVIGQTLDVLDTLFGKSAKIWRETIRNWSDNPAVYKPRESFAEQLNLESGRVVLVHLAPVILQNDFLGTVLIFRDITIDNNRSKEV